MEKSKDGSSPSSGRLNPLERAGNNKEYLARIHTLLHAGFSTLRNTTENAIISIENYDDNDINPARIDGSSSKARLGST